MRRGWFGPAGPLRYCGPAAHFSTSSLIVALMCLGSACGSSTPALWPGAFRLSDTRVLPEGARRYLADASDGSHHCQFNIQLKLRGRSLFGSKVTFGRIPNADCRGFLEVLAQVLHYKGAIPSPKTRTDLSAPMAFLGDQQVRLDGSAGFTAGPGGTWFVSKLFLGDGSGEVYFDLDETNHIGEFSLKDDDYAAEVITELASILLPS